MSNKDSRKFHNANRRDTQRNNYDYKVIKIAIMNKLGDTWRKQVIIQGK